MRSFVIYDPSTGQITGRVAATDLDAIPDLSENRLEVSADEYTSAPELHSKVVNGAIQKRAVVIVSVDKDTIQANGTDEAVVTFTGLESAIEVKVNRALVTITPQDNQLVLTSDVVADLKVSVSDSKGHRPIEPVVVKAR